MNAEVPPRVRAAAEMRLPFSREYAGMHEYDGEIQDLSPDGVQEALGRLGGGPLEDWLDEATVSCQESAWRMRFGTLELHRRTPSLHVEALDLSCYERDYAPEEERLDARRRHLAGWPRAVDAAIESLDRVPADVAKAFIGPARGLGRGLLETDGRDGERGREALERLVAHLEQLAAGSQTMEPLGAELLAELLGCGDGITIDLKVLKQRVAADTERMQELLRDACAKIAPGQPVASVVRDHVTSHGSFEEILELSQRYVDAAQAFIEEHDLAPHTADGECRVEVAPPPRRWAAGQISWSAPWERPAPSIFHITPPDPSWSAADTDAWLRRFGAGALPVLAVHEAFPGHANQAQAVRHVSSPTRRTLWAELFFEAWATYSEEFCLEEGFLADDPIHPVFQAGVARERLMVLACATNAIGLACGESTLPEAVDLFAKVALFDGPAALAEARRCMFEPTIVRYALGKFLFLDLRERLRHSQGHEFSLQRFHADLLGLGSPPVGPSAKALGVLDLTIA